MSTIPTTETDPNAPGGSGTEDEHEEGEEGEKFDEARARAKIKKINAENATMRARAKAAEDKLAEADKAQLTDKERAERERDEARKETAALTKRVQKTALRAAVFEEASDLGITNAKLAMRLLDADDVEWDDDGEPTNVSKLLKAVLKEVPELKGSTAGSPGGADGGQGRGRGALAGDDINASIRAAAGR